MAPSLNTTGVSLKQHALLCPMVPEETRKHLRRLSLYFCLLHLLGKLSLSLQPTPGFSPGFPAIFLSALLCHGPPELRVTRISDRRIHPGAVGAVCLDCSFTLPAQHTASAGSNWTDYPRWLQHQDTHT